VQSALPPRCHAGIQAPVQLSRARSECATYPISKVPPPLSRSYALAISHSPLAGDSTIVRLARHHLAVFLRRQVPRERGADGEPRSPAPGQAPRGRSLVSGCRRRVYRFAAPRMPHGLADTALTARNGASRKGPVNANLALARSDTTDALCRQQRGAL
jgi:hypothetical protein